MIAVKLIGRIGNQLFIYAIAEAIRQRRGRNEKIVFYDKEILDCKWKNSLEDYDLPNVEYRHDFSNVDRITRKQMAVANRYYKKFGFKDRRKRLRYEKLFQPFLNALGIVSCIDGYAKVLTPFVSHVYINGYFQSPKYFEDIANIMRETLSARLPKLREKEYVRELETRNSVCISIKVEHNVGHPSFDVCDRSYYERAIAEIVSKVDNPLFFICSDNVPYVLEHFVDTGKYDYICQEQGLPVSDALAIMGMCKHFVIGNTSYGWWAQFLSYNSDKIVIAPNRWYRTNIPCDIYQANWHLVDVTDYIEKKDEDCR